VLDGKAFRRRPKKMTNERAAIVHELVQADFIGAAGGRGTPGGNGARTGASTIYGMGWAASGCRSADKGRKWSYHR